MNDFEATLRRYIGTRNAMLACRDKERAFSCEACEKHHDEDADGNITAFCDTRQAWIDAHNAANDITGPEGEKEERLERFKMAKPWQNESAGFVATHGGTKTYGINRAGRR